jgi:membrane protein implicated in regulation of membrane protease activity
MKPQLKEHMKNMTSFIALMLSFYIFVYYMITFAMIITWRTLTLHPSLGFLAHVIASLVILLTIYMYEPRKNQNDKTNRRGDREL